MEERRKSRRFKILRPAALKIPAEGAMDMATELEALADNVAIDGALLITQRAVPVGTEVEITLLMPNDVRTSCAGKIVRVIADISADGTVGLGIECTRPFSEPFRVEQRLSEPLGSLRRKPLYS